MTKICLITHISDNDGALPLILARQVYDEVEDHSCEVNEVDEILKEILTHHEDYDFIYITDLSASDDLLEEINNNEILNKKFAVYDHHQSREYQNKFPFVHVIVEENGRKQCASSIFYKYLKSISDNPIFDNKALIDIIELTRELDTYDFNDDTKEAAFQLGELYNIYGRERFITNYTKFIQENNTFYFTETENILHEIESERNKRYIEEKLTHVKKAVIDGIPVGIVFAEKNRSELGHAMASTLEDIDIAIIINVDRSISLRANKEEIDVNILAVPYGGGGHKHAGGISIPNNLQEKICEFIFKDVNWELKKH